MHALAIGAAPRFTAATGLEPLSASTAQRRSLLGGRRQTGLALRPSWPPA